MEMGPTVLVPRFTASINTILVQASHPQKKHIIGLILLFPVAGRPDAMVDCGYKAKTY